MNIQKDIRTLTDMKELLQKLSFHIEKTTLEKQVGSYKEILNRYRSWQEHNTFLHHSISQLKEITDLIGLRQYGDGKLKLQQSIETTIQGLHAAE